MPRETHPPKLVKHHRPLHIILPVLDAAETLQSMSKESLRIGKIGPVSLPPQVIS